MKKIEIFTNGAISIDNNRTGLYVTQDRKGTIVYTGESTFSGTKYKEHTMPSSRYALSIDHPASGNAGRSDFERDLIELIERSDFTL